jgi:hypothetical protein
VHATLLRATHGLGQQAGSLDTTALAHIKVKELTGH